MQNQLFSLLSHVLELEIKKKTEIRSLRELASPETVPNPVLITSLNKLLWIFQKKKYAKNTEEENLMNLFSKLLDLGNKPR